MGPRSIGKSSAWRLAATLAIAACLWAPAGADEPSTDVEKYHGILFQGEDTRGDLAMEFSGPRAPEATNLAMPPGSSLKVHLPVETSVKSARFSLFPDGDPAPDAVFELRVNGSTVSRELPATFDAFDLGDHLVPGDNVIELILNEDGSPVELRGVRVDKVMAPPEEAEAVEKIRSSFKEVVGREARASELGMTLEQARKEGFEAFFAKIKGFFARLFGREKVSGLSRREIMDFQFSQIRFGAKLSRQLSHTPIPNLQLLAERARFALANETDPIVRFNASKVLRIIGRLNVPGGTPPPNEEPPAPPEPPPPPPAEPPPPEEPPPPPPEEPPPPPPAEPPPPPPPPAEPPPPPPAEPPPPPPAEPPPPPAEPPPPPPAEPPPAPPPPPPGEPDEPPADGLISVADWYPLKLGNVWSFIDTANGNHEFDLTAVESTQAYGNDGVRVTKSGTEDWDIMSNDGKGLRLLMKKDKNGTISWEPGVTFCEPQGKVGSTYTSLPAYRNPGTGNPMEWTVKFVRFQDVQVPAGEFKNCALFKLTVKDSKLGTRFASVDMWLGKNVGLVKRQGQFFGQYFVQVLKEARLN